MSKQDNRIDDETVIERYTSLAKTAMESERREEIWHTLQQEMHLGKGKHSPSGRSFLNRWGWRWSWKKTLTGVTALLLLIVGGGLYGLHQFTSTTTSANSNGVLYQGPAQVVTSNWRVVIYHSILKPGPYYDVMLFYNGSRPLPKSWAVNTDWNGKNKSSIRTQVEATDKGSIVLGYFNVDQIQGFKSSNKFKITWGPANWHHTPKGNKFVITPGHKRRMTIELSRAKTNLHIANYHEYKGETAPWTVSYAYEDIVGRDFHYRPEGIIRIDFAGQHGIPKFTDSIPGKFKEFTTGSLSNTYREMVNSKIKNYQFGNGTKMTVSWKNKKAVVTLKKMQ